MREHRDNNPQVDSRLRGILTQIKRVNERLTRRVMVAIICGWDNQGDQTNHKRTEPCLLDHFKGL